MPRLIQFTLESRAATDLAKEVMLSNSGSKATLYQYMYATGNSWGRLLIS